MSTGPPAVTIGPPKFRLPSGFGLETAARSGRKVAGSPSGTSQARAPVVKLMATSDPQGGGEQGSELVLLRKRRRMTFGEPSMRGNLSLNPVYSNLAHRV